MSSAPTGSLGGQPSAQGQQLVERLSLGVAGAACLLYVLHSLPPLLFPSGLLASALTLLAGVVLGLAAAAATLVLAFYRLTKAKPPTARAPELQPPPGGRARGGAASLLRSAATAPGPLPPPAIALGGEYAGVVWTAPASRWRRSDTVASWPPPAGAASNPCGFRAWHASLAQGTLVLRPILPPPSAKLPSPRDGKGGGGGAASAGGSPTAAALLLPPQPGSPAAAAAPDAPDAAAAAEAAAPTAAAPAKVGIPLEGCTVELVEEGLNGRSEFIRRAPLLVSHPKWNLLDGEPAFYLWADSPAAKQQWLHALGWWCQDAQKLAAIEAMYAAYCEAMRDRSCLEYPEQAPQWGPGGSGGGEGGGGGRPAAEDEQGSVGGGGAGGGGEAGAKGRRGWKGWGDKVRRRMSERRHRGSGGGDEAAPPAAAGAAPPSPARHLPALPPPQQQQQHGPGRGSQPPSEAASPAKPSGHLLAPAAAAAGVGGATAAHQPAAGPLAAELQSLESIMEAKWMQSRKIQMPAAISEAVSNSRSSSAPTSPRTAAAAAVAVPSRPSPLAAGSLEAAVAAAANGSDASGATSLAGSLPADGFMSPSSLGPGSPAAPGNGAAPKGASPPRLSSAAAAAALPPGSPLGKPPRPPVDDEGAGEEGGEEGEGAAAAAAGGTGSWAGLPEGLPPLLSPDFAVNALLTRMLFDLLRRPDFTEHVRARIQRQLSRIQRPDYIQSLEVVAVDCGGAAPTLRNLRALAQPEASIWPQLLFDMRYQGAFTVTIEMKVDIRDAAAWGKLDQALTRLAEGRHKGGGGAGGSASQPGSSAHLPPPHHAASAPALHGPGGGNNGLAGGEEEEEGEEEGDGFEQALPGGSEASASSSSAAAMGALAEAAGAGAEAGVAVLAGALEGGERQRRGLMGGIRQRAARKLRQLAESTATKISRIPLRLSVTFSRLEGAMVAWLPPPPGNRVFYAFVAPPLLELTARPEMAGRLLKYSYHVARVSSWLEQRMRAAITKNMVFPGGGDLLLPALMALSHPNAADPLPALGRYVQQAAQQAKQQQQQQQQVQEEAQLAAMEGEAASEQPAAGAAAQAPEEPSAGAVQALKEALQQPVPATAAAAATAATAANVPAPAAAGDSPLDAAAAAAPAAGGSPPDAAAPRWSDSVDELQLEPSLSYLPSPQQAAAAAAAAAASKSPNGALPLGSGSSAGGEGGVRSAGSGHLISHRYSHGSSEGGEAVGSPGFQGWAAPPDRRTAADAWDAAMATEGWSGEAPTPKFAAAAWQQQQQQQQQPARPLQQGLAGGDPLGVLQAQQQAQQQQQPAAGSAPAPTAPTALGGGSSAGEPRRPGLQLKLSATRSLDPDFTRSAEHTGFGESPASALPNYGGGVRRTLSAAHAAAGGARLARVSGATPTSPEAVGEALSRSLANLRRQKSDVGASAAAAGGAGSSGGGSAAGSPPQRPGLAPASSPLQRGSTTSEQHLPQQRGGGVQQVGSPQLGSPSSEGDPRRPRQLGSFKEQANRLFSKGKALASQVQQRAAEHAAQRAAEKQARRSAGSSTAAEAPHQL